MNWLHLIDMARLLTGQGGVTTRGRPRQAMLKRAVSAAYYAMFHVLCDSNANALIGTSPRTGSLSAWTITYRALDHNFAREQMRQNRAALSSPVQNFGETFRVLQENRHRADYDPNTRFSQDDAVNLIDRAENAIQSLLSTDPAERRELAAVVLLRGR